MKILALALSIPILAVAGITVHAQDVPVLTASLHEGSPAAFSIIQPDAAGVDVARITLSATVGDVYINGLTLDSDVVGGLSNFTDIKIYDTRDSSLVGYNRDSNIVHIANTIIGNGQTKTYLLRASLSPSAAGTVRLGFSGVSTPTLEKPTLINFPIFSNSVTLPRTVVAPTPSPSPTPAPTPVVTPVFDPFRFVSLAAVGLTEGDTISAPGSSDPDIYIVNEFGYKRLFLNPVIFNFYGHLGGFSKVKNILSPIRDGLVTSSYFRNCETNDPKIYSVEVTGEDTGTLHWINTSGAQAAADDPHFFKKVFCINTNEFSWYTKGLDYTSVLQVQRYTR